MSHGDKLVLFQQCDFFFSAAVVVLIFGLPFPAASLNRGVVVDDKSTKWASQED